MNQGFIGALEQFWTVNDKPRLNRKNTYFEDHPKVSNYDALKFGVAVSTLAVAIVLFWSLLGVIL